MLKFKIQKRLLVDSKHFLLSMPWSYYDFLVDLSRLRAAVEFHKMFKYPELLMISGRISTAMEVGAKTPSHIHQVCVCSVFVPVCS